MRGRVTRTHVKLTIGGKILLFASFVSVPVAARCRQTPVKNLTFATFYLRVRFFEGVEHDSEVSVEAPQSSAFKKVQSLKLGCYNFGFRSADAC